MSGQDKSTVLGSRDGGRGPWLFPVSVGLNSDLRSSHPPVQVRPGAPDRMLVSAVPGLCILGGLAL